MRRLLLTHSHSKEISLDSRQMFARNFSRRSGYRRKCVLLLIANRYISYISTGREKEELICRNGRKIDFWNR